MAAVRLSGSHGSQDIEMALYRLKDASRAERWRWGVGKRSGQQLALFDKEWRSTLRPQNRRFRAVYIEPTSAHYWSYFLRHPGLIFLGSNDNPFDR